MFAWRCVCMLLYMHGVVCAVYAVSSTSGRPEWIPCPGVSVCYVHQQDALLGSLTVRETLQFSANMRLPRQLPVEVVNRRVSTVARALDLEHVLGEACTLR